MKKNKKYLQENLEFEIPVCHWLMYLEQFFGEEKTEEFCEYLINARQIMRKNDIRTVISRISLSVYSVSPKEQLVFVGIYNPIDQKGELIQKMEKGFEKAQRLYRKKNFELAEKIKKLGYSYTTVHGNWKDKNEKDTYQREQIFIIFSEKKNSKKFESDICNLVKEYNINSVMITDEIEDKPKAKIKSKLLEAKTGNELEIFSDTTIGIIEKYFSDLHNTRFLFKIPYERNKKILWLEEGEVADYYTPKKQEIVKNSGVHSFNMAMYKQALMHQFSKESDKES